MTTAVKSASEIKLSSLSPLEGEGKCQPIPFYDVPMDVKRLLVEYIGVARASLIPFLPQTYFSCWDIVLCLGDIMSEGVSTFSSYIEGFEKMKVNNDGHGFNIRSDDAHDHKYEESHTSLRLSGVQAACVVILAAHAEYRGILLELMNRRKLNKCPILVDCIPLRNMERGHVTVKDWTQNVLKMIEVYVCSSLRPFIFSFVENVLMRESQYVESFTYAPHFDNLIYMSGGYRQYLRGYNPVERMRNTDTLHSRAAPFILKEIGIVLSDWEVATIGSKYLVDERRIVNDFNYLIHLFVLSYAVGGVPMSRSNITPSDSIYNCSVPYSLDIEIRRQFLYRYFIYHKQTLGTVPTIRQCERMRSILPQPDLTPYENALLCQYFRIDLGEIILHFLTHVGLNYDPRMEASIPIFVTVWIRLLEERERIIRNSTIYRTYGGSWRRIGPYKKFMMNLIDVANERWIAAGFLRRSRRFTDKVICRDNIQFSLKEKNK